MSVIQSIMDFIHGREQSAPVDIPPSLPQTHAPQAPNTPPIREGYMPENSGYVNKVWKDTIKSRSLKKLVKTAEEADDERNAKLLPNAKWSEAPSREDAVNEKSVKWTDADKIRSMEARARLEEGERKREEARLKAKAMREP